MVTAIKSTSAAKNALVKFLEESKLDIIYTLRIEAAKITDGDVQAFVHKMRVELSRARNKAKAKKRVPKHFKMLFQGFSPVLGQLNRTTHFDIRLLKTTSANDVTDEVDAIFSEVAGGEMIENG